MKQFKSKKIFLDSETVAEQLRSARQKRGLKIEAVAKELSINKKYLEALEKGNFNKVPAGAYSKNFLKEYCLFLGINRDEIIEIFQKELDAGKRAPQKELFSKQVAKARYFIAAPKIIKNLILAIIIIACLTYLGMAVKKITAPPFLSIDSPGNNFVTNNKNLNIIGLTEAESEILINGKNISSDSSGKFSEEINLKEGINIITITAKKKYSRENTIIRQILVKE